MDFVVRVSPVCALTAVTEASGTAAPDASSTVPFREPRVCWENPERALQARTSRARTKWTTLLRKPQFMIPSLRFKFGIACMNSRLTVLPGPRSCQKDRALLLASFKVIAPISLDAGLSCPRKSRQEERRESGRLF